MPTYDAEEHELKHYGILRRSGRYPWGSGGDDSVSGRARRGRSFLEVVSDLEKQGMTKSEIAKGFGMTTTQLRDATTIANNAVRRADQIRAEQLRDKGWSVSAIGREMGRNESSVRELLKEQSRERAMILENTVEHLRGEVDKGGWVGIGAGSEYYVSGGISKEKLRAAVAILKEEGYEVISVQVDQGGTKNKTTVKTLCPPGTTYKDVVTSKHLIREMVPFVTEDGGRTSLGILPPKELSSSRVAINYKDVDANGKPYPVKGDQIDPNSGAAHDGVIYVRPGVEDISLGGTGYAQVRINVDGTHYLKGMAMYKDDLPDGVDILFNTNKKKADLGPDKLAAMKKQEDDPDNPFGAVINRQITKDGPKGRELTSVMNIIQEEGSWDSWSKELSSQVLSKQSPKLAERLLNETYRRRREEYEEIAALTNPTVKEKLLKSFSDSVDSDAVHLSAAGMPRSSYHVILPFNSLKDNEVYAPNFDQGERVALIRYPHGGTFEIPELTVNNNAPAPKAVIGRAKDAVGINHRVAERLSGADFDGDFVMVIPNNRGDIKSSPPLRQLENFDPQKYKLPDSAPRMTNKTKQREMGNVSNLITDMTIQRAPMDEIARAVKHSMVVIDAEKHHLDYKRSAQENGIHALKEKYQGRHANGQLKGASTLISRATSEERVLDRRPRRAKDGGPIDAATGRLMYEPTGRTRTITETLKDGTVRTKVEPVTKISTKLAETDDARTLMSKNGGTVIERVYAEHSNRMKALANLSRKEMVKNTAGIPPSPTAKRVYKDEVAQLKNDLQVALKNSPRERQAQVLHNAIVSQKLAENPGMEPARIKKVRAQALAEARTRVGAKKILVPISDRQWEAIQAGAVSKSMLRKILDNADLDEIKQRATPKQQTVLGSNDLARARSLANQGLTQAEIARVLGVSLTTLKRGQADG